MPGGILLVIPEGTKMSSRDCGMASVIGMNMMQKNTMDGRSRAIVYLLNLLGVGNQIKRLFKSCVLPLNPSPSISAPIFQGEDEES